MIVFCLCLGFWNLCVLSIKKIFWFSLIVIVPKIILVKWVNWAVIVIHISLKLLCHRNGFSECCSIRREQGLQLGSDICEAIKLQTASWSFSANYHDWPWDRSSTLPWLLAGLFLPHVTSPFLLFISQMANMQISFMIPGEASSKRIWSGAWSIRVLLWMQKQQDGTHQTDAT